MKSPPRKRRRVGSIKAKKETKDLLEMLDERYKDVVPDTPPKRARPSFIPDLSSDTDEDTSASLGPMRKRNGIDLPPISSSDDEDNFLPAPKKGKKKVIISSDDFDPSAEPHEDDDDQVHLEIDASDDDSMYQQSEAPSSPQRKAQNKGKGKATSRKVTINDRRTALLHSYDVGEKVPAVLLISLKAGALGLQLTVANNVYLMVSRIHNSAKVYAHTTIAGPLVAGTYLARQLLRISSITCYE